MMKKIFLRLVLLLIITSCQNTQQKMSNGKYNFSISYIHSGEGGDATALDQFVANNLKGRFWEDFQKIEIRLDSQNKVLEINRIAPKEKKFKIITKQDETNTEIELEELTKDQMQKIIDDWM